MNVLKAQTGQLIFHALPVAVAQLRYRLELRDKDVSRVHPQEATGLRSPAPSGALSNPENSRGESSMAESLPSPPDFGASSDELVGFLNDISKVLKNSFVRTSMYLFL